MVTRGQEGITSLCASYHHVWRGIVTIGRRPCSAHLFVPIHMSCVGIRIAQGWSTQVRLCKE
jgi:hypothetical protein